MNNENKIQHFNRVNIALLRNEIQNALKPVKQKYGLTTLELQNITFNESSFTARLAAALPAHSKQQKKYNAELVKQFAKHNGLPQDMLNRTFISNGKPHTITGIEIRNPKFPIITKCSDDGKSYKFTVQMIKEILARNANLQSPHSSTLKLIYNSGK